MWIRQKEDTQRRITEAFAYEDYGLGKRSGYKPINKECTRKQIKRLHATMIDARIVGKTEKTA